jgi:hypothetical protein
MIACTSALYSYLAAIDDDSTIDSLGVCEVSCMCEAVRTRCRIVRLGQRRQVVEGVVGRFIVQDALFVPQ